MSERFEFPGFIDVHVHFRDPGVPEAETTESGLAAAAAGGIAAVVTMPNTMPACDSPEVIRYQTNKAEKSATRLLAAACITKGRLGRECAEIETLYEAGAAMFTDDGTYVADQRVLEEAMRRAAALKMVVSQHALSPEFTEPEAIRRDLSVCRVTGCRYHVQHLSTAAGVELVMAAQREGLPVTAEATPHHLLLTTEDIVNEDPAYKMAPPLAGKEDRAALRAAVKAGALMFATDHAPHPAAKKKCRWAEAANGIVGIECAVGITYRVMVEEEGMKVDDWARAWWELPRALLPAEMAATIAAKSVVEVGEEYQVEVEGFKSRSMNCPYQGLKLRARARLTD